MAWRIGTDIGGTFIDVAMIEEESGRIRIAKLLTTPNDLSEGVIAGIRRGLERNGVPPAQVSMLSHATTVVTNALLERKGARAGFVTTRGFRDILELRRSSRVDLYDLFQDPPAILIPRRWRFEITERIDAQGDVVTPLAEAEIETTIAQIRDAGLETVAVSFLHSFRNDAHERRVGQRLREALPDVGVFLSCDVLPEMREFERASTTAVCAYVGPLLGSYLGRLQSAVAALGLPKLYVMGSSGGIVDVEEGLRMPAMVVESGPAAGVVAAARAGAQLGLKNLISFDMGGTTAKASLIADGEVAVTAEYEVGGARHSRRWLHGTGHPIRMPVIDLAEVSAGGGSIAWVDVGGALKVGPQSAGAVPGPAAYGKGGEVATVTDADVVLGYLNPQSLLAGDLTINLHAAERAIERSVGRRLGLSVPDAAARIVHVVNSNMAQALRIVTIERGHDPRNFSLIAFGGAGPVHAAALAAQLEIPEVIIPAAPGAFSALGLVATDLRRDYSRTLFSDVATLDPAELAAALTGMARLAEEMLETAGIPAARREITHAADVRYRRQLYELTVPIPGGTINAESIRRLAARFHAKHRETYGHADEREPRQLVNVRTTGYGRLPSVVLRQQPSAVQPAPQPRRRVWFEQAGLVECAVYWRDALVVGSELAGPTVIEALDSTIVVPPGWAGAVDDLGFVRMRRVDR